MIRMWDPQIASLPFNQLSYAESFKIKYKLYLSIQSNFQCLFRKEVCQTMEASHSSLKDKFNIGTSIYIEAESICIMHYQVQQFTLVLTL